MNIIDRFISYTKINTTTHQANGAAGIMPSSEGQRLLARTLTEQLHELGLTDVTLHDNAIVTATLPANVSTPLPCVAFFAHLDTSSEYTTDTHAQIVDYQGGDICLNAEKNIYLKQAEFPELARYQGDRIIVTDGTSLLGADNKAAIAAIMDALQYLINNPEIPHGDIRIAFVPDEEQGLLGAKAFETNTFGADFGYTLDACGIGELIYENWNAGQAKITFIGQPAHPMSAKGKLRNSLLMAHKFISLLPAGEAPEYTENREGYYWVKLFQGNNAQSVLNIDIRDFSPEGYQKRKNILHAIVEVCQQLYGKENVHYQDEDLYENVYQHIEKSTYPVIELAKEAYQNLHIEPNVIPMRGGYDGAIFSQKGIPCPNLFSGAHNFHSIYEYLPVNSLKRASDVVIEIVRLTHQHYAK